MHQLVKPSVDYVCRLRFPLGNYPPCVGDERDLLVHWCHGAPGVVFMLLQAYKVRVSDLLQEPATQKSVFIFSCGTFIPSIEHSTNTKGM